jgi:hypothetical protein
MDLADWVPFFTASAGASAALVGLLIVAMSVNVEAIIATSTLPSRAGATIAELAVIVVASVLALIPHLGIGWLAVILILTSLLGLGFGIDSSVRMIRHRRDPALGSLGSVLVRAIAGPLPVALTAVAGILVFVDPAAGLVLTAVGFGLIFVNSVLNAWVLLIEIRR